MRLCLALLPSPLRVLVPPRLCKPYTGSKGTPFEVKFILFSSYPGPKKLVGFSFLEDEWCVDLRKSD